MTKRQKQEERNNWFMVYTIDRESIENKNITELLQNGITFIMNKSGDAAFRVWCSILCNKSLWISSIPHISKDNAVKGLKTLIEDEWIIVDEEKGTISVK